MGLETIRTYEVEIKGANSVKELKKEISDLRDKLVQLDNTSDEYKKTVDELIVDETKLKEVMAAGKNEVSAATGSYNALVQEMGALKKVWREVTTQAERDRIGARIKDINDQLKTFDSSIGNNQRKVGSYEEALKEVFLTPQQQLRKLRVELAGLQEGTEEYNRVFKQMSQLTHDVTEQQEMLKYSSADLGDIIGNVAGTAQGLVGGFSALNAAMGLMGNENEDIQKAMLKTQQLMALVQGIGAMENLGKRLKGLIQGLKGFVNSFNGGAAALGEFDKRTDAAAGSAAKAATSINTQATSMSQAAVATEKMTQAVAEFLPLTDEEIQRIARENREMTMQIALLQSLYFAKMKQIEEAQTHGSKETVNQLKNEARALEEQIEAIRKKREEGRETLKQQNKAIGVDKRVEKSIKNETKATKELTKAEVAAGDAGEQAAIKTNLWSKSLNTLKVVGVKAFAALKTAIIATGIGLLIVGISTLLSKLVEFLSASKKVTERINGIKEAVDDLAYSNERLERSWSRQERILSAQGASYEVIYAARRKNLEAQLAEVQATIKTQEEIAKEIGAVKLRKKKYDEFRESLQGLYETQAEIYGQIADLSNDKYAHSIEQQRLAEEERAAAAKAAAEAAANAKEQERKKAEELYKQTVEYFKDEKQKLKEKYEEEKALLEKYGLSTVELTRKYEKEKTKIVLDEMKSRYDRMREYNSRQNSLLDQDSLEWYETSLDAAKELQETIQDIYNENGGDKGGGTLKQSDKDYLKNMFGIDVQSFVELEQQLKLANKAVKDAEKALLDWKSTKAMEALSKESENMANTVDHSLTRVALKYDEMASSSSDFLKGFYSGLSPKDMKAQLDESFNIQNEALNDQIALYEKARDKMTLNDPDRIEVENQIAELRMQQQDLVAQHTIDSNNLIIDSYNLMADSIQTIVGNLGEVLGSVADIMMDNAEAAYEAGDISKEAYEKQFEQAKGFQIAQAVINTISGALGAFMGITRDTGGWGWAAAIAEATAVLAAGYAQINQIKKTKPNSSGGGSSSTSYAVATPKVEDYNPQAVVNATGQSETENLANAISKTPLRAYVVESDITSAQSLSQKRQKESTF